MDYKYDGFNSSICLLRYQSLVESGAIESDQAQCKVVDRLDQILEPINSLVARKPKIYRDWWRLKLKQKKHSQGTLGLYLYGGVGTGKSMLMDLFYNEVTTDKKLRTHFHSFMQDTHRRINKARHEEINDPIRAVAANIAKTVSVLCFDEFQITDIADAMIVGRFFSILIENGTFVITTSNRHPDDLYQDGLNRKLFLPFIDLLKSKLHVMELKSAKDYRREKLFGRQIYFEPINERNREQFNKVWNSLVVEPSNALELNVNGRAIYLARHSNGVGWSSFGDLCSIPLGALDYLLICQNIRVLFLEGIPVLSSMGMDSARRFVTLVDTLYENRIKLICLAEQKPEMLYPAGKGSFEFKRTVSRLYEMQSQDWIGGMDF